ncbi:MAG TPA: hypothetical protein PK829_13555 [Promineifilum sp.]|nr:hypothetical protein [Promineifilum sp.]
MDIVPIAGGRVTIDGQSFEVSGPQVSSAAALLARLSAAGIDPATLAAR